MSTASRTDDTPGDAPSAFVLAAVLWMSPLLGDLVGPIPPSADFSSRE
jgi:hypothetical protein